MSFKEQKVQFQVIKKRGISKYRDGSFKTGSIHFYSMKKVPCIIVETILQCGQYGKSSPENITGEFTRVCPENHMFVRVFISDDMIHRLLLNLDSYTKCLSKSTLSRVGRTGLL